MFLYLFNYSFFSITLSSHHLGNIQSGEGQTLSLSYGCFFAEFLEDHSLVRLGLLDLITCVGLRYDSDYPNLRSFSWKSAFFSSIHRSFYSPQYLEYCCPDLPKQPPYTRDAHPIVR